MTFPCSEYAGSALPQTKQVLRSPEALYRVREHCGRRRGSFGKLLSFSRRIARGFSFHRVNMVYIYIYIYASSAIGIYPLPSSPSLSLTVFLTRFQTRRVRACGAGALIRSFAHAPLSRAGRRKGPVM